MAVATANLTIRVIEAAEQTARLVRGGATIPLRALADQTETLVREARQIDGLGRDIETMDSRRMGDDHLDHADIDPESYRTDALIGAHQGARRSALDRSRCLIFSLPRSRLSVVNVAVFARDAAVFLPRTYRL